MNVNERNEELMKPDGEIDRAMMKTISWAALTISRIIRLERSRGRKGKAERLTNPTTDDLSLPFITEMCYGQFGSIVNVVNSTT